MSLERLQQAFAAALADRRAEEALQPMLADPDGRALERLALYRGNLTAAWCNALAGAYPVTRVIVGGDFFEVMARAYGRAHPSRSGDLNAFGERLPDFIDGFEPAGCLPYLSDVARVEWLAHRAHYAADATPLAPKALAGWQPQALLAARFELHPACAWLASKFPIAAIWRAHQPDATEPLPDAGGAGEHALLARPRWQVVVVRSGAGEQAALQALRDGRTLQEALEAALDVEPACDLGMLPRWLELGVLIRIHPTAPD